MKKVLVMGLIAGITVLTLATFPNAVGADSTPKAPDKAEHKAARHVPFHGKVETLDKSAGTMKVGERTFHVTASTKITKAGRPASLDEAVLGEEVGGAYQTDEAGHLEVTSLRIGPKPAKEPKHEQK